jgi:hypothetical protein
MNLFKGPDLQRRISMSPTPTALSEVQPPTEKKSTEYIYSCSYGSEVM